MKRKSCDLNKNTERLKSLMNNEFNVDTALNLIRKNADPAILNSKQKSLEDLIIESYLGNANFIDEKKFTKTEFIYYCRPVTIYVGKMNAKDIVIKEINADKEDSRLVSLEVLRDYCREIKVMQQLTNAPNVISLLGYNLSKSSHKIIMDYASNGSLSSFIEKNSDSPLNWELRIGIISGIIQGLKFIHLANILHCDLKGDNIFIDENFQAKIGDFGSAKMKNEKVDHALTTPYYAAPEAFKLEYSEQSDIFGLGLTMWEACAWAMIGSKLSEIIEEEIEMYNYYQSGHRFEIPEDTPPKMSSLIKWCWETDAKKRPSSAELPEELGSGMENNPNSI